MQTELWEAERQRSASLEREVTALQEQLRNAALGRRLGAGDDGGLSAAGGLAGALGLAAGPLPGGVRGPLGGGRSQSPGGRVRDMEAANMQLFEELNAAKDAALSTRAEADALQ